MSESRQGDFVYMAIYRGALKVGATDRLAKDHAIMGLEDYKKGKFDKAINLINDRIQRAKKESKNDVITTGKAYQRRANSSIPGSPRRVD